MARGGGRKEQGLCEPEKSCPPRREQLPAPTVPSRDSLARVLAQIQAPPSQCCGSPRVWERGPEGLLLKCSTASQGTILNPCGALSAWTQLRLRPFFDVLRKPGARTLITVTAERRAADLLMTGCGPVFAMQHVVGVPHALARRGLLGRELFVTRTLCSPGPSTPRQKRPEEVALGLYHRLPSLGRALWHSIQQQASSTAKAWWGRYEEFVGLNEVREAQGNVTEAEKVFMVARGLVREAREELEVQQAKLKEVRDRLDRVSREDSQYLELATLEHRMLQEEKRLRTAYLRAEDSEREKFSLFSAAVRESHEKERTRAERTKNWSLIGSVLGALIGVAGSTYVNRVRLQELKALLLEAQKGPVSLQEAIREQASSYSLQQRDLHDLMVDLRGLVHAGQGQGPGSLGGTSPPQDRDVLSAALKEQLSHSRQVHSCLEGLREQLDGLEKTFSHMAGVVQLAKTAAHPGPEEPADGALPSSLLEQGAVFLALSDMEQRLEAQANRNTVYSTLVTCVTFVATLPVLYMLFKAS